ncbi:MAG TPA: 3-oxoacyl-ACP reductase family protein [Anaerolineae bacterium]|nr:3-oxoacyl-ACP reductase family protein [Anaerolineae bacterium]
MESGDRARLRLHNQVALVTGGSRGLGNAICLLFAREGAKVVVNYRKRQDEADKLVARITDEGGEAIAVQADVSKSEDVKRMVQATVDRFGAIDILVNNAGISFYRKLLDHSEEDWDHVIGVNLKSIFLCCKYAIPHIQKQNGGVIINVGSCHAFATQPDCTSYAASKAGMVGFNRSLALELAPYRIRVNVLVPGAFWTPMAEEAVARLGPQDEVLPIINAKLPLGRQGEPDEFAQAALFLAADSGSYTTGQVYIIDGGLLASMHL